MLKIFNSLDEVPEALREHYELSGGKYVPKVSDDHPLIVNNRNLLNEKTAAESKAAGLQSELSAAQADVQSAKSNGLPRGHVAVAKADAEAMEKLKEHGSATEIAAKLTEHTTLRQESDKRTREDSLRNVAKVLGYNEDAFVLLHDLPEFDIREKDGKKTVIAKVKEGENIVEKPAQEFLESSKTVAPFLPALKSSGGGTNVLDQRRDAGGDNKSIFDRTREDTQKENAAMAQTGLNAITERFGFAKTA